MRPSEVDVSIAEAEVAAQEEVNRVLGIINRELPPGKIPDAFREILGNIAKTSFLIGAGWMRNELNTRAINFIEGVMVMQSNRDKTAN